MRTLTILAAIGIALMISMGITLAKQTQGTMIVYQNTPTEIEDDGCPCRHTNDGGFLTMSGGGIVCPSIIDGIMYIQSQGEAWYNAQVQIVIQQWKQQYIHQFFNRDHGKSLVLGENSGTLTTIYHDGVSSLSIESQAIPYYGIHFLSWETLQARFAEILAYNNGGPEPSFWTPQQVALYTSPSWCVDARTCLELGGALELGILLFMALSSASTNPYGALAFIGLSMADILLVLCCINSIGG